MNFLLDAINYILALWVKYASLFNGVLLFIVILFLIRIDKKLVKLREYRRQSTALLRLIALKLGIPEGDFNDSTTDGDSYHLTDV